VARGGDDAGRVAELCAVAAEAEEAGDFRRAGEALNAALGIDDADPATWARTARLLARFGEHAQACGAYDRALELAPDEHGVRHDRAQARYRLGMADRSADDLRMVIAETDAIQSWLALATVAEAAPSMGSGAFCDARVEFGRRLAAEAQAPAPSEVPAIDPAGDGRVRVGYVSSWFDRRNYMTPVWALVHNHDRSRFRVTLLADRPPGSDYRPHPDDRVIDTSALDNIALAEWIDRSDLDVVVDLNAYSTAERLGVWATARRPVTVAWFNLHTTSGLAGIDHLIGDAVLAPEGDEAFAVERLHRLPGCAMTFAVGFEAPPVAPSPWHRQGHVTFGALATMYKLSEPLLDAWCKILRRVPESRLLVANRELASPGNRAHLRDRFERRGIASERVELRGGAPYLDYLRNYDEIDIGLDSFPYSGGTTTNEALWQGVPVVTQRGDRWVTRTSATLMHHAGLGEFVADDVDGYVDLAVGLAETPGRLAGLRTTMRDRLAASPTCDAAALARQIEAVYLELTSG